MSPKRHRVIRAGRSVPLAAAVIAIASLHGRTRLRPETSHDDRFPTGDGIGDREVQARAGRPRGGLRRARLRSEQRWRAGGAI